MFNKNNDLDFILSLIDKFGGIDRLGHVFQTERNGYYYDNGTGKVICLESDEYLFFKWLFDKSQNHSLDNLSKSIKYDNYEKLLSNIRNYIEDEHLFQAPFKTSFISAQHKEDLYSSLQGGVRMITLELTQECNLRCRYCTYNDHFEATRGFSGESMSKEIVKASIEFLAKHGSDEIAVTFYGGEPLLKFDLLKYAIEYSIELMGNRKLTFSITSNLTLMTKEMAEFLISVDGLNVLCSIDGTEEIHNEYRKYPNGKGSFSDAMRGLNFLVDACKARYGDEYKIKASNRINFNSVFTPPYSTEKVEKIQEFFNGLSDLLPMDSMKNITYTEEGSLPPSVCTSYLGKSSNKAYIDPIMDWVVIENAKSNKKKPALVERYLTDAMRIIHKRPIITKPAQAGGFNACCVPGVRRSYICTNGDIKPCEKIGNCPTIGSAQNSPN